MRTILIDIYIYIHIYIYIQTYGQPSGGGYQRGIEPCPLAMKCVLANECSLLLLIHVTHMSESSVTHMSESSVTQMNVTCEMSFEMRRLISNETLFASYFKCVTYEWVKCHTNECDMWNMQKPCPLKWDVSFQMRRYLRLILNVCTCVTCKNPILLHNDIAITRILFAGLFWTRNLTT